MLSSKTFGGDGTESTYDDSEDYPDNPISILKPFPYASFFSRASQASPKPLFHSVECIYSLQPPLLLNTLVHLKLLKVRP